MGSSESAPSVGGIDRRRAVVTGAVGGLIAGVFMGVVLHFALGLMPFIGAMVGVQNAAVGWVVHLCNSALFGVVFVPLALSGPGREMTATLSGSLGLGVVHGAILGLLTGGLLLPVSLQIVGVTGYPVPLLPIPGLASDFDFALLLSLAHLLYGLVLGGIYGVLIDTRAGPAAESAPIARS